MNGFLDLLGGDFLFGGQAEFNFGLLDGRYEGVRVAERRVIVTPDESTTGGTHAVLKAPESLGEASNFRADESPMSCTKISPDCDGYLEHVGTCRLCKKGEVYLIHFGYLSSFRVLDLGGVALPVSELRCTYCK